ncbi:DUF29 family protein [Rhizobium sp. Z1P35]
MSYETDFVQWTREQAALLRALDPSPTGLDADNLAEEIEALGRIEISNMSRHFKIEVPDFPAQCPLTVEQLVDEDFDFPGAIKRLESRDV